MRTLLIIAVILTLSACSVYRIDIQQGNTLDPGQVSQLKADMTASQVRFLLGTPLLEDPFHPGRWDYIYDFKPGSQSDKPPLRKHLVLFFKQDKLVTIDRREGWN